MTQINRCLRLQTMVRLPTHPVAVPAVRPLANLLVGINVWKG